MSAMISRDLLLLTIERCEQWTSEILEQLAVKNVECDRLRVSVQRLHRQITRLREKVPVQEGRAS